MDTMLFLYFAYISIICANPYVYFHGRHRAGFISGLILNGFHFRLALISLSNKNWEISSMHKKRGDIFCSPFLQKDDLNKFVHILFLPITAQHKLFQLPLQQASNATLSFPCFISSPQLDVCPVQSVSKISSTPASCRLISLHHKLISHKMKKRKITGGKSSWPQSVITVIVQNKYSQATLWTFRIL